MNRDDDPQVLAFACPHCYGPLHVEGSSATVACAEGHRFTVEQIVLEQARESSRAAWRACRVLEDRARATRWALSDPDLAQLASRHLSTESAVSDEETVKVLRRQAQALDLTITRMTKYAEQGSGSVGS